MIMNPFSVNSGHPGIPSAGMQSPVAGLAQRFQAFKKGVSVADISKGALKPAQRALTLAKPWKAGPQLAKTSVKLVTKPVSAVKSVVKSLKFW